jgi:hypothetical protein
MGRNPIGALGPIPSPHPDWPSGTRGLSDREFVAAFESLKLGNDQFRHYDHVRLAWIYLRDTGPDGGIDVPQATERMAQGIRAFALHHGGSLEKFHETITRAFVRLVAAHMRETPEMNPFSAFAAANPRLFDPQLPFEFYSRARLMSPEARAGWMDSDLRPLPA